MLDNKIIHTNSFITLCDDIVLTEAPNDEILEEGIKIIDEKAKKEGVSFYEMMWQYLSSDPRWKFRLVQ